MIRIAIAAAALAIAAAGTTPVFADGDAEKGKKVFNKCKACHDAEAEKNKVGPHLVGIIGRAAAAVEGFKYSDAMIAKGAEGLVWDAETIAEYVKDPKGYIPKNKMAFAGLKKDDDVEDVIAYLMADPKP